MGTTFGALHYGHAAQSFANDWGIPSTLKKATEVTYRELEQLWNSGSPLAASRPCCYANGNTFMHFYGIVDVSNGSVTVLEPYRMRLPSDARDATLKLQNSSLKPAGSTVLEDGIYRMDFSVFQKAFHPDEDGFGGNVDIGYLNQFPDRKVMPLKSATKLDAVIATGKHGLSGFHFKTQRSEACEGKISWTVSKPTEAVVQVLQDRFLARDQDKTQWDNDLAPKFIFKSEGKDGRSHKRVLCPNRMAWGNKEQGGILVSLKPGMTYWLRRLTLHEHTSWVPTRLPFSCRHFKLIRRMLRRSQPRRV